MGRNLAAEAVVLRAEEAGEGNRRLTIYAADAGIIWATAYGGMKGKLRGLATPFNHGRVYIYRDPVRNSVKVTDFDVRSYFPAFRESLVKFYTVSLWAEFLMRSRAGGAGEIERLDPDRPAGRNPAAGAVAQAARAAPARPAGSGQGENGDPLFRLFVDCLYALDGGAEELAPYLSVQFIWRAADLMGFGGPVDSCIACGSEIGENGIHWYSVAEGGFLCAACSGGEGGERGFTGGWQAGRFVPLDPGGARYLARTTGMELGQALRVHLGTESLLAVKRIAWAEAERIVDGPLRAIETGNGIL